ncbi:MAG: cache domain-containing protein [Burkholderiales bacterium]|nr:cache domain-containing protein [Burkholderiales bacterium]
MVLLPLAVMLPLLGALLIGWGSEAIDRVLLAKVRADLAVAHGYFERVLGEVGAGVGAIAESQALALALAGPSAGIDALLRRAATRQRLDFLHLLPADAATVDATSVEVLGAPAFAALAPALLARVAVPLRPTLDAAPTARRVEDRAMVLRARRAVRAADNRLVGWLEGGVLLNRNLRFIDHLNEIVYPEGSLPFGGHGTATLFLGDVRISTNVRLFGSMTDERAIGTRVSRRVRDLVLGSGHTWLDRAFVVDDWYVSGYLPLADGAGERVGMLYVGVLERPYTLVKIAALAAVGALLVAALAAAAGFSLRWARSIFRPLEQMEATLRRVQAGELGARVGETASGDEIGRLARHLDRLLAAIEAHTGALDAQVAERTRALREAQQGLLRNEKLATVGRLTAGIAHEVNNPIAVIQGNLDVMRELLGPEAGGRVAAELGLVDEQIERMRLIVTRLLQYAKPGEFAGRCERIDIGALLDECLALARHQPMRGPLTVERDYRATGRPLAHRGELQQVFVNLIVNALQAMPGGGTLTLGCADAADGAVEVVVADTGTGLPAGQPEHLFEPFVTRRTGGTGLGLWISRSIVERCGGEIAAANRERGGAVFTLRLPVA